MYRGDTYYWTKDREFEKFLDLPRRRPRRRSSWPPRWMTDVRRAAARPRLAPSGLGRDLARRRPLSRRTSSGSRGEFTVARDQYVRPRTGWFSDRSACYLAAGRPVITQETGFSKFLPDRPGPVRLPHDGRHPGRRGRDRSRLRRALPRGARDRGRVLRRGAGPGRPDGAGDGVINGKTLVTSATNRTNYPSLRHFGEACLAHRLEPAAVPANVRRLTRGLAAVCVPGLALMQDQRAAARRL